MKLEEDLIVEKRKKIIGKIVTYLASTDPNLYYTDSSTIATMVLQNIDNSSLKAAEKELIKDLTSKDVLVLMSYNSNCCQRFD